MDMLSDRVISKEEHRFYSTVYGDGLQKGTPLPV
jgi:hypothetical protein